MVSYFYYKRHIKSYFRIYLHNYKILKWPLVCQLQNWWGSYLLNLDIEHLAIKHLLKLRTFNEKARWLDWTIWECYLKMNLISDLKSLWVIRDQPVKILNKNARLWIRKHASFPIDNLKKTLELDINIEKPLLVSTLRILDEVKLLLKLVILDDLSSHLLFDWFGLQFETLPKCKLRYSLFTNELMIPIVDCLRIILP